MANKIKDSERSGRGLKRRERKGAPFAGSPCAPGPEGLR